MSRWDVDTMARPGGCQGCPVRGHGGRGPDDGTPLPRDDHGVRLAAGRRSVTPANVPDGLPSNADSSPRPRLLQGSPGGKWKRVHLFNPALVRGGVRPVIWRPGLTGGWTAGVLGSLDLHHPLQGHARSGTMRPRRLESFLDGPGAPARGGPERPGGRDSPPGPGRTGKRGRPAGMTRGESRFGALPGRPEGPLGRSPVLSIECRALRNLARPLSVQPRRRRGAAEDLLGGGGGTERCRADGAGPGRR